MEHTPMRRHFRADAPRLLLFWLKRFADGELGITDDLIYQSYADAARTGDTDCAARLLEFAGYFLERKESLPAPLAEYLISLLAGAVRAARRPESPSKSQPIALALHLVRIGRGRYPKFDVRSRDTVIALRVLHLRETNGLSSDDSAIAEYLESEQKHRPPREQEDYLAGRLRSLRDRHSLSEHWVRKAVALRGKPARTALAYMADHPNTLTARLVRELIDGTQTVFG